MRKSGVLEAFLSLPDRPKSDRRGGFLFVIQAEKTLLTAEIGDADSDFYLYAKENIWKLIAHSLYISNWKIRNPKKGKPGAAIRTFGGTDAGKYIFLGFSGQSEHGDEAIISVISLVLKWSSLNHVREIAAISNNPFLEPLIQEAGRRNLFL